MAERRCVVIKGLRLYGAHVCLFDSPPVLSSSSVYRRGVTDICHIMQFPKPAYCKLLPGGGEIIAEIPFTTIEGYKEYSWGLSYPAGIKSAPLAVWKMWQLGARYQPNPGLTSFWLRFLFCVYEAGRGDWYATGSTNIQTMTIKQSLLNPSWLDDDEYGFSIGWIAPNIPHAPAWSFLDCQGAPTRYNSGVQEILVEKASVYQAGFKINLTCGPLNFDYGQYLTLPPTSTPGVQGWGYENLSAMRLVLVVRKGLKDFKVCWPESVFKKPRYAMVVDAGTGLVVGPPLEIY